LIDATATDVVDTYEKLRAAALCVEPIPGPGLGIIHRQGLAAWIRALGQQPRTDAGCGDRPAVHGSSPAHEQSLGTSELTRLIANVIVSIGMEHADA